MNIERLTRFHPWLRHAAGALFSLRDTLSRRRHSEDFNLIRGEYLRRRVWVVGLLFVLLCPLWLLVDYALLPMAGFQRVAVLRTLMLAGLLAALWLGTRERSRITLVLSALAALLLIPVLFYASLALLYGAQMDSLAGYAFIPLLLAACLGVFPLTLAESLGVGSVILALQLGVQAHLGHWNQPQAWQDTLLLIGLLAISLWANYSQVSTLLRLYRQASQDPLTELLNRGRFITQLTHGLNTQAADAEGRGTLLSILMFDLDHFKAINDRYGHAGGDQVLIAFARLLRRLQRPTDISCRYGGEEFLLAMPQTTLAETQAFAQRVQHAIHAASVQLADGRRIRFTASIGAAQMRQGETLASLLKRVDDLLYQAKKDGRDRISAMD